MITYIKKYKYFILCLIVLVSIIGYLLIELFKKETDMVEIVETTNFEEIIEEKIEIPNTIKVDIKGAIKKPGVYELEKNSRVNDVINISGGLNKDADTSTLNLSKILKDEMIIIVYTKKEIQEMKKEATTTIYVEKECVCPKLENDACIEDTNEQINNEKISLNNATLSELMTLSGIGESKAKAIIEYREKNGFKTIEEIKNITGIGESIYEKIKDSITI